MPSGDAQRVHCAFFYDVQDILNRVAQLACSPASVRRQNFSSIFIVFAIKVVTVGPAKSFALGRGFSTNVAVKGEPRIS